MRWKEKAEGEGIEGCRETTAKEEAGQYVFFRFEQGPRVNIETKQ